MRFVEGRSRLLGFSGESAAGITWDISGDLDMAKRLSNDVKEIEKAQKRAIGTMARRLRVEARRDIQREYNLKAAAINERLFVGRKLDGLTLTGKSSGINLINFGARQTRKGVTYAVKKGQRETRAHAFIRSTRSGHGPFVWMRGFASDSARESVGASGYTNDKKLTGFRHGYPIFQQFGPSVAQMLKHGDRPERLVAFAEKVLRDDLDRQLGTK